MATASRLSLGRPRWSGYGTVTAQPVTERWGGRGLARRRELHVVCAPARKERAGGRRAVASCRPSRIRCGKPMAAPSSGRPTGVAPSAEPPAPRHPVPGASRFEKGSLNRSKRSLEDAPVVPAPPSGLGCNHRIDLCGLSNVYLEQDEVPAGTLTAYILNPIEVCVLDRFN